MDEEHGRHGDASMRVAGNLREAILRGEFPPGTRLRQEQLAEDSGASRVPVREALRILESEGLVTLVANTGAWIASLSLDECVELYQVRERLEPLLLRYSIPRLTPEALAEIDQLAKEMSATGDIEEFLRLDREFHLRTYAAAETTFLSDTVLRLWNSTQHYRRAFTKSLDEENNRIIHDEHHLLVHSIRDKDLDGAERVLRGHIRRTRRLLAHHPEVFA